MPLSRESKQKMREGLTADFQSATSTFVAGYSGLSVGELTELRQQLRKADTKFKIIKNKIALKSMEVDSVEEIKEISSLLKGPVAVAFVKGDPAQAAKTLLDFQKVHPALKVKGGVVDSKPTSLEEITEIASLPSKDELLAKIVGSIVAPHRGLLNILTGVPRNLVQVINAIKDKKS